VATRLDKTERPAGYDESRYSLEAVRKEISKDLEALLMAAVSAIKEKYGPDTRMVMEFDEDAPSLPEWVFGETDHVDRWGLVYNS
jgi:hypothetical protein